LIELLASSPTLFTGVAALLGLLVGSFLNVVVYRLPLMMEREWKSECRALLEVGGDDTDDTETFSLVRPRSRCPHCGHQISALENVPILSYALLRGKCSVCKSPISLRYPFVELLSAVAATFVAMHFGFGLAGALGLVLTWALIALAAIDIDTQLLPDSITQPLLWLGILANYHHVFVSLEDAVLGAIGGYLILWAVFWGFKLATGKEGMGYGDFKLLALLGAWMGWQVLPAIIVLSSVVGACFGIGLMIFAAHDRSKPLPFGPYLATAGWIVLLWGGEIMQRYLHGGSPL